MLVAYTVFRTFFSGNRLPESLALEHDSSRCARLEIPEIRVPGNIGESPLNWFVVKPVYWMPMSPWMMKSCDDETTLPVPQVKPYTVVVDSDFLIPSLFFTFRRVAIALNSNKNKYWGLNAPPPLTLSVTPVSYTHLTLPTNREV